RDRRLRLSGRAKLGMFHFFSANSTDARVFSQSRFMVQFPPVWSKEMVKFSTGDGSCETFMSTRARSSPSPGYGMPHSPVFLLITRVHLSCAGIVKIVYLPAGTSLPPTGTLVSV